MKLWDNVIIFRFQFFIKIIGCQVQNEKIPHIKLYWVNTVNIKSDKHIEMNLFPGQTKAKSKQCKAQCAVNFWEINLRCRRMKSVICDMRWRFVSSWLQWVLQMRAHQHHRTTTIAQDSSAIYAIKLISRSRYVLWVNLTQLSNSSNKIWQFIT